MLNDLPVPPEICLTLSVPVTLSYARALAVVRPSGPVALFLDEKQTKEVLERRLSAALSKILAEGDKDIVRINLGEIDIPITARHAIAWTLDREAWERERLPATPEVCVEYLRLYLSREYWEFLAALWEDEFDQEGKKPPNRQLEFNFTYEKGRDSWPNLDGRVLRHSLVLRQQTQWRLNFLVHERGWTLLDACNFCKVTYHVGQQLLEGDSQNNWQSLAPDDKSEFLREVGRAKHAGDRTESERG